MTVNEYQECALKTLNPEPDKKDVLNLYSKSGEAVGIVKKQLKSI